MNTPIRAENQFPMAIRNWQLTSSSHTMASWSSLAKAASRSSRSRISLSDSFICQNGSYIHSRDYQRSIGRPVELLGRCDIGDDYPVAEKVVPYPKLDGLDKGGYQNREAAALYYDRGHFFLSLLIAIYHSPQKVCEHPHNYH